MGFRDFSGVYLCFHRHAGPCMLPSLTALAAVTYKVFRNRMKHRTANYEPGIYAKTLPLRSSSIFTL